MAIISYTGGKNPFGDGSVGPDVAIGRFAELVRARNPGITDMGVSQVVARALGLMKPRMRNRIVPVLGRDIMADRVQDEPFWPLLGERQRQIILAHPIRGGATITADMNAAQKLALMSREDRANVNRSVLVTRHGDRELSRTYVWSVATDWTQDVDDSDWELLLEYRQMRSLLLRVDTGATWSPVVAYSHIPVTERHAAATVEEAERIRRSLMLTHHHTGVDV